MSYDFFGVQTLLINRLKATIANVSDDYIVSGLNQEDMLLIEKSTPAIYVLFDSYSVLNQSERESQVTQRWLVVTLLSSDRDADAKTAAGPILGNILESLLGWQPSSEYGILWLDQAPKMTFQPAVSQPVPAMTETRTGLWHVPLAFSTNLYVNGSIS